MVILINAAYFLMLCAFITRDVLHLRTLLIAAQSLIAFYAWRNGVPAIAVWNLVLVAINTTMTMWILGERRAVSLPPDLLALHQRHFGALSPQEFLRWWRQGERTTLVDAPIARAGEHPDWLYFLLDGTARVTRNGAFVVDLRGGSFAAEMSLLTGAPANADVDAVGTLEVVRWPRTHLHDMRLGNPALWTKIQSVIGHDLVEKIQRGDGLRAEYHREGAPTSVGQPHP